MGTTKIEGEKHMNDQELLGLQHHIKQGKRLWAASFGVVISLIAGIMLGMYYTEGRILDDCKYSGVYRVGTQAFTCIRKM
jgi:hypothetical protein